MVVPEPLFGEFIGPEHDWFAWFPVPTVCGWKWLTTVRRRRAQTLIYLTGPIMRWWVHAPRNDGRK